MTPSVIEQFLLGFSSFLLVGTLTPLFRRVALRAKIFDKPNQSHKTHTIPTPYLGGVAIAIGISSLSIVAVSLHGSDKELRMTALTLFVPALALGLVGLIDDLFLLQPFPRFVAQSVTGLVVAFVIASNGLSGNPSGNQSIDILISALWIVLICNSMNFFDNVDGGAAGSSAIIAMGIVAISASSSQVLVLSLAITTMGGVVGFLIWNTSPAKIYMGDAGSLFLGVILAVLTVRVNPQVESPALSFSVPLLIFAIPLLDTTTAVLSRIFRGVSPFQGGRDHLSHRLINLGLTKKSSVYVLWASSFLYVILAFLISIGNSFGFQILTLALALWLLLLAAFLRVKVTS